MSQLEDLLKERDALAAACAAKDARIAALEEEHRWIARNLHSCPACACEGCRITMDEAAYRSKRTLSTPSDTSTLDAVVEKAKREAEAEFIVYGEMKAVGGDDWYAGLVGIESPEDAKALPLGTKLYYRAANLPAQGEGEKP